MPEYAQQKMTKVALKQRLIEDGQWGTYVKWRSFYWSHEVPKDIAWKVAAYFVPPLNGAIPEITVDPMYASIAAGIKNGKYPEPPDFEKFPNGATNFAKQLPAEPEALAVVAEVKAAPKTWKDEWEKLAQQVGDRQSSELDDIRWVVANYLTDAKRLVVADIPSTSALAILSWAQMSASNFGELLRTNYSKLLPDRKQLEYENRFSDDGRDLALINDFERHLELEVESPELQKESVV